MQPDIQSISYSADTFFNAGEHAVHARPLHEEDPQLLPLVIEPAHNGISLVEWIKGHKPAFEKALVQHGGILFRGFGIDTVDSFNQFMNCFDTAPLPYMFRSSPRTELDKSIANIYRSTIYPSDRKINMHNESSYSRVWGRKIVFCCIQQAEEGGETPIADSRKVLQAIPPELVQEFRVKGVKYRRNLLPDLGMPWQEVFQTTDRAVVEETCKKINVDYTFRSNDHLVIEWVKPAVYKHPQSGVETWFNHAFFFNKYSRYEELDMDPEDELPDEYLTSNTFFGDGSEISFEAYSAIKAAYDQNMVVFPYQKGDIIFLDNMLAAHGRSPYKGDRTIATAIIEAASDTDSAF